MIQTNGPSYRPWYRSCLLVCSLITYTGLTVVAGPRCHTCMTTKTDNHFNRFLGRKFALEQVIEYKIIYRECEGGTRGSPIGITRLAE